MAWAQLLGSPWTEAPCGPTLTDLAVGLMDSTESSFFLAFGDTSGGVWQPVHTAWSSYEHLTDGTPRVGALTFPDLEFTGPGITCNDGSFSASIELAWAYADAPVWVHHPTGGLF